MTKSKEIKTEIMRVGSTSFTVATDEDAVKAYHVAQQILNAFNDFPGSLRFSKQELHERYEELGLRPELETAYGWLCALINEKRPKYAAKFDDKLTPSDLTNLSALVTPDHVELFVNILQPLKPPRGSDTRIAMNGFATIQFCNPPVEEVYEKRQDFMAMMSQLKMTTIANWKKFITPLW